MSQSSKLAFLERQLGKSKYSSNTKEAEFFSPFVSHHKPKLSINLETDKWQCWVSGKNGKRLLYVLKEAGASRDDIKEYVEKYKAKDVVISSRTLLADDTFSLTLPQEFSAIATCKNSVLGKRAAKYLYGRGLTDIDILQHKIGVVPDGGIVFPSFDKSGKLNMFTTRLSSGQYYSPWTPKGYKNSIILNELNIDWSKPVVLVEGFMDMSKSTRNTIPLFGSSLNYDSILFESLVARAHEVVLAFDSDAWKKSDKVAKILSIYDVDVSIVGLGSFKDVGEMSKDQFKKVYETRQPWTPESSFLKRVRALC